MKRNWVVEVRVAVMVIVPALIYVLLDGVAEVHVWAVQVDPPSVEISIFSGFAPPAP
jgi:hypothetical protein